MAEEFSPGKVVGGVGMLLVLTLVAFIAGGSKMGGNWWRDPPPCPPGGGGGPNCAGKKANNELAQDGSTCTAGVTNSYVCQANGAACGPGNQGACATVPLGGGKCACACQM